MLIYVLLFILLQVSFSIVNFVKPGVLGVTSNVEYRKLIELTNKEREKVGLPPVSENSALKEAARMKASNMFSENYWSHFAPSGKSPWDFILGSGYKFSFAGENLAKNFYNSEDVVVAWMNSQTHKENILNPKYNDIGIAVVEGMLDGQQTTLVVQMFGTTQALAAGPEVNVSGENHQIEKEEYESKPLLVASVQTPHLTSKPTIDPYQASKTFGLLVIAFIAALIVIDLIVLRRRGIFRVSSHRWAHLAFLSAAATAVFVNKPGAIL